MILIYVSVGNFGEEDPFENREFSGETWYQAWNNANAWIVANRVPERWYRVWG